MHTFETNSWNSNPYHGNDTIVADWYDKKRDHASLLEWDNIPSFVYPTLVDQFQPYIDAISIYDNIQYQKALSFATQIILPTYLHFTISQETLWLDHCENNSQSLINHKITILTIVSLMDEVVTNLTNSKNLSTNELTYYIGDIRNKLCNLTLDHNISLPEYNILIKYINTNDYTSLFNLEHGKVLASLELRRVYHIIKRYFNADYPLWAFSQCLVRHIINQIYDDIHEHYKNKTGDQNKPIGNHYYYHLEKIIGTADESYTKLLFSLMCKPNTDMKEITYAYTKLYQFKTTINRIARNSRLWDCTREENNAIHRYLPINQWNKPYSNSIDRLTNNWTTIKPLSGLLEHNENIYRNKIRKYGLYGHMNQYSFGDQYEQILANTALSSINDVKECLSDAESCENDHSVKTNIKLSLATVDFCATEHYTYLTHQ